MLCQAVSFQLEHETNILCDLSFFSTANDKKFTLFFCKFDSKFEIANTYENGITNRRYV